MGGTNKWRQIPFAEAIAKSQHEYINRARLTGVLSRGILQLPKICSSLSLIKFMVQGRITKRLQYNFHFRVNMLWFVWKVFTICSVTTSQHMIDSSLSHSQSSLMSGHQLLQQFLLLMGMQFNIKYLKAIFSQFGGYFILGEDLLKLL